jgi:hypothetical protein
MSCNQRDSQLVMIQEITTEERKFLEMPYYQRDSQLVMIQETTTEAPKAIRIKKGKPYMLQLAVQEEIILEAES